MTLSSWQPTVSVTHLKMRAEILAKIREFFAVRGIIEVETPLLCGATVTNPHIASLTTQCLIPGSNTPKTLYLQTSPEYAMKRLLAAGIGPIYQISKSFRADERGQYHNPEFTMLEWYRPGFHHRDLMIEVDGLLRRVLNCEVAKCETYGDLFQKFLQLDPYQASVDQLKNCAAQNQLEIHDAVRITDVTSWLQLLMSHLIEPHLGKNNQPTFVVDFPIAQAALAKADPYNPDVAERFEVYWRGIELANGFHELCDPIEQRSRFEQDNAWRVAHGLPVMALDENFLAALEYGLPDCSGVALGIDRLVMAALEATNIAEVIAFPVENA